METTIEFKTDSVQIKEMWPYVYDALKTKRNKFSIPILLFAATEEDKPFEFFEGVSNKEMIHASYKEPICPQQLYFILYDAVFFEGGS
jgi:hypothetical protein